MNPGVYISNEKSILASNKNKEVALISIKT